MRTPHLVAAGCAAGDRDTLYCRAERAIWDEFRCSLDQFPRRWASPVEGAMVLEEEIDEVWDEVRGNRPSLVRAEATQAGAMGLRFIVDVCEPLGDSLVLGRKAAREAAQIRTLVGPSARSLASSHEGVGFLKLEFKALWSAVCAGEPARERAVRVIAAATRLIAEIPSTTTEVIR
ncbi:MAG: hypothetical protein WCE30_12150 [Mycobacterium sp.]